MKNLTIFVFLFLLSNNGFTYDFESYGFDSSLGNTDVLIAVKDGKIIYEKYQNDYSFDRPHNLHSLSKLFLSVFIAHEEFLNHLDLNTKIAPNYPDPFTSNLTLEHLIQMSSGRRAVYDFEAIEKINFGLIAPIEKIPNNMFEFYMSRTLPMYKPGASYNYSFLDNCLAILYLEKIYGKNDLVHKMNSFIFDDLKLEKSRVFIDKSDSFLWAKHTDFLNKLIYNINRENQFRIPHAFQAGASSPEEVLKVASMFLNSGKISGKQIFKPSWIKRSWDYNKISFEESQKFDSFFAKFNYGYYWFLNRPFKNGRKPYEKLPSDMVAIMGLRGQTLAIFPSQRAIYLRLASDKLKSRFDRHRHLEFFYNEYLKK